MRVLRFLNLFQIHVGKATHVQQAVVGVFVVDGNQTAA